MSKLKIDLFTPNGVLLKNLDADEVSVNLKSGEIGILPGHENFLGQLKTGIVSIRDLDKFYRFSVTHGVCKVENNRVTLLSTTSEPADKIDLSRAQIALKNAQDKLSNFSNLEEDELIKYQRKQDRAEARIRLAYLRQ